MRVLIIVLCYNGISDTITCLHSLQRLQRDGADWTVAVVDNASTDRTPEIVRTHFPDVVVIENGRNLGYAAGNNVGLLYAVGQRYDYALLLNNDTIVDPLMLDELMAAMDADPSIAAVGPTIYYTEEPDRIWSAGGAIDWRRGASRMEGIGEREYGQYQQLRDVDFVSGCVLLLRCDMLERIGLLDERFFMYFEETEWCVRARRYGFRVVHAPRAKVWHSIPLADRVDKPYVAYYMTRNRLLFLRATDSSLPAWVNVLLLQDLRTVVSYSVRPKWRHKRAHRDAMLRGALDFLHARWGRGPF